jgi:glycerophosphoryl diester phosphodiesterase
MKDTKWMYEKPAAHRGFHDNKVAPENSLLAIKKAVDAGYNIEFDVHMTKSKVLVVHHDFSIKRTTGLDMDITDIDTNNLEQYKLFGTNEHIPTFDDVLNTVDGKVNLIVEIKPIRRGQNLKEVVDAILDRLSKYNGVYCLESFDLRVVDYLHKNYPDKVLGQLYEGDFAPQRWLCFACNQHKKVDFLAICIKNANLKKYAKIRKKYPEKVFVTWTVRTLEQQQTALKLCDSYIFETNTKNDSYIAPPPLSLK